MEGEEWFWKRANPLEAEEGEEVKEIELPAPGMGPEKPGEMPHRDGSETDAGDIRRLSYPLKRAGRALTTDRSTMRFRAARAVRRAQRDHAISSGAQCKRPPVPL